jgi:aminoglycoside/choline kinase family phosphotransferase
VAVRLASEAAPDDLPPYDAAALEREVGLFTELYAPALDLHVDTGGFRAAWQASWGAVLDETRRAPVMVLRDFHADNLMVVPFLDQLGLLDFQDALAGHRAYDLVSLLQDARRDVAPELKRRSWSGSWAAQASTTRQAFRADMKCWARTQREDPRHLYAAVEAGRQAGLSRHAPADLFLSGSQSGASGAGAGARWVRRQIPAAARGDAVARRAQ